MFKTVASMSFALADPPFDSKVFIFAPIEIEPIVYEAETPELTSSSAVPSNSISCLAAPTVKSSLIAIVIP